MINIIFQDGIGSSLRASATAVQDHGRSAASHPAPNRLSVGAVATAHRFAK
jgi:hypothetical protein